MMRKSGLDRRELLAANGIVGAAALSATGAARAMAQIPHLSEEDR